MTASKTIPLFDKYACDGDTVAWDDGKIRFVATLHADPNTDIDDDDSHNTDATVTGCNKEQQARLMKARNAYYDGDWWYCGVAVVAYVDGRALCDDYPSGDSYHHESHVDRDYNLSDAAILLEDLGQYEETDSGLWDGQEPRRAIATQAAFTYGNAVLDMWRDLISEINDDSDIEDLFNQIEEAESSLAEVEEALGTSGDSASEDEVADANTAISEYEAEIEKLKAALPAAVQSVIDGF